MSVTDNGAARPKRPQLSESIEKLDEMITDLSTAIPGAVAESVREALGPAFAAAVKDAVREAVAEAFKEAGAGLIGQAGSLPPPLHPAAPPRPGTWARVKAAVGRLRRWAARTAAPVFAHAALGWGLAKLVGAATVRSRVAALLTALSGTAAGLIGFAAGPVGASILLGLTAGTITAAALWAAPAVRVVAAFRDDGL